MKAEVFVCLFGWLVGWVVGWLVGCLFVCLLESIKLSQQWVNFNVNTYRPFVA
jgi:hypothetical protein